MPCSVPYIFFIIISAQVRVFVLLRLRVHNYANALGKIHFIIAPSLLVFNFYSISSHFRSFLHNFHNKRILKYTELGCWLCTTLETKKKEYICLYVCTVHKQYFSAHENEKERELEEKRRNREKICLTS